MMWGGPLGPRNVEPGTIGEEEGVELGVVDNDEVGERSSFSAGATAEVPLAEGESDLNQRKKTLVSSDGMALVLRASLMRAKREMPMAADRRQAPTRMNINLDRRISMRPFSTNLIVNHPLCPREEARAFLARPLKEKQRTEIPCFSSQCPREESNLDYKIRNLASYPLNDEGRRLFYT